MNTTPMDFKVDPRLTGVPEFPILMDKYEMLLQEIDVLLQTSNTDVLCAGINWANIRDYIFTTRVSESTLQNKIRTLIYSECPSSEDVDIDVTVQMMQGELSDIGIITVTIKNMDTVVGKREYYVG